MTDPSFDPEFAAASDWARLYRANGVQIVPCKNKIPRLKSWKEYQNALVPDAQFEAWYGHDGEFAQSYDMGMLTGTASGNILMIDLDFYKAGGDRAKQWWGGVLMTHNNSLPLETWQQRTGGGGIQLFFTYPQNWKFAVNAKTDINVDVRCQGGFAVLPPTMHASGNAYVWEAGYSPWEVDLMTAPDWLLEEVEKLIREHGGGTAGNGAHGQSDRTTQGTYDAFGHQIDGRETKMRDLVWGAVVDWCRECPIKPSNSESSIRAAQKYQTYEDLVSPRDYDAALTKTQMLDREGRGPTEFAVKWLHAMDLWETKVAEEARKPGKDYGQNHTRKQESFVHTPPQPPASLALRPAFPITRASIPVRDWAVPGLFLKRNVSLLVAPPGSGKSLLSLQWGIMMGKGMTWGGWTPRKAEKVLIINIEDDFDEMQRRLFVAAEKMGVSQPELADRIFLAEEPESIVVAKHDVRTRSIVRTPLVEELVKIIQENGIGVVIVDPFAETFEGDESNNSEVKWAGVIWREVARRTGVALVLVHHTKKYSGDMAGNADASRGGGSMIGISRILVTLFDMTADEAAAMGIPLEDRNNYVRFDDAKANHNKKGVVRWFEKQSVNLGNGTGFIDGDDVGVLVPWKPPGMLDAFSDRELNLVLDSIDKGVMDDAGTYTGQLYSPRSNGGDRWVGKVLMRMLDVSEESAKAVVKSWLESGLLEVEDYDDPVQRKSRKGVRVDSAKRPGTLT